MAGEYNFTVDQGSDFSLNCTYKDDTGTPIGLSGGSIVSYARANKEDSRKKFQFTGTLLNQATYPGQFILSLDSATSSALDIKNLSFFYYDVEFHVGSVVTRLFQGVVTINREVTR